MGKKQPEHSVHVRVDHPVNKRKAVIQTAISSVELLKRYDEIKRIRAEKELATEDFRKVLKSIHRLLKLVRIKEMPLDSDDLKHIRTASGKRIALAKKLPAKLKKPAKPKVVKTKSNTIDDQLDDLHRKLQSL